MHRFIRCCCFICPAPFLPVRLFYDYRSLFFAIVFAIVIGSMFVITYVSGDNVTILNYENAIIDKYENWEQKLDTREKKLDQREAELKVREKKLEQQEAE